MQPEVRYVLVGRGQSGTDGRSEIVKTEIFEFLPKVILSSDGHAPRISDRIGARKGSLDSSRGSGVACEKRFAKSSKTGFSCNFQILVKSWKRVENGIVQNFRRDCRIFAGSRSFDAEGGALSNEHSTSM